MKLVSNTLLALFRPTKGVDGLGESLRWLWIPLAVLLVASVLLKVNVAAPLRVEVETAEADAILASDLEKIPEEERAFVEQQVAESDANGAGENTAKTALLVFGVLGAIVSVVFTATFLFIASRTWASLVGFTTMLAVAALSLVPNAIRNLVQAIYMASTGVWLRYPGLGALVAPTDPTRPPSAIYALLSQVDLWMLWGLAILFGALTATVVGFPKKRAVSSVLIFVAMAALAHAIPAVIIGMLAGGGGASM